MSISGSTPHHSYQARDMRSKLACGPCGYVFCSNKSADDLTSFFGIRISGKKETGSC